MSGEKKSVTRRRDSRKAKLGSIQPFPPKDMLALVPGSLLKKRGGRRELVTSTRKAVDFQCLCGGTNQIAE